MALHGEAARKFLAEQSAQAAREHEEELAKAKAEAAKVGKEPFDLHKLDELWVPAMDDPDLYDNEAPSRRAMRHRAYEWHYYVLTPEIRTMDEFARYWKKNEMWLT